MGTESKKFQSLISEPTALPPIMALGAPPSELALFVACGFNELEKFIDVNHTISFDICGMEDHTGFI